MGQYKVYLETGADGGCLAHVLELPGCYVAAADRPQALTRLPELIRAYCHDLIRHGRSVIMPEQIALVVVEEQRRDGCFDPDDRAALFEPERQSIPRDELEHLLQLAAFNRRDLLALIRGLSDSILDWRPQPGDMSIRRILNHVGRAELWYISRISEEAVDGPDWRSMPGRRFLDRSRTYVVEHFRALDDAQLAALSYPLSDGGEDSEAWTARKALRRLLEHEREHAAHIRHNLAAWRRDMLARLAASRSRFVWQLVALDEGDICDAPLFSGEGDMAWTPKDLLAHIAAWDELYAQRTALIAQGKAAASELVELEQRNAELAQARRAWALDEALQAFIDAREHYVMALGGISDVDLYRRFKLPWASRVTLATWARWRYRHDDRHTKDLLDWRDRTKPRPAVGPKAILQAALESGRQEMLATAALLPSDERETRPVCGVWTLKDVLGHLADWEWYGLEKLDGPPSRRSLDIRFRGIQKWNEAHAAARQHQTWDELWSDFQAARLALGQLLQKMSQDDLAQHFAVPWSKDWTLYRWIHLWLHHEREHAADLRANLDLPNWPKRLKAFE